MQQSPETFRTCCWKFNTDYSVHGLLFRWTPHSKALETWVMGKYTKQTHHDSAAPPYHDRSAALRPTAHQIWQFSFFAKSEGIYTNLVMKYLYMCVCVCVCVCVCGVLMVPRSILAQERAHQPLRWLYTPPDKTTHSITSEFFDLWLENQGTWDVKLRACSARTWLPRHSQQTAL